LNLLESFVTVAGIISGKRLPATQEIIARDEIARLYADATGLLQWEPQFADISGDLGYTWGHYQFNPGDTTIDGHRQGTGPTSRGYYDTIWKKSNGDWKYVLDTGVAGPKEGSQ
jgi:hypothetical protein